MVICKADRSDAAEEKRSSYCGNKIENADIPTRAQHYKGVAGVLANVQTGKREGVKRDPRGD